MSDIIGIIKNGNAFFAKNSDRFPNEAQYLEFYPHEIRQEETLLLANAEIAQVKETNAILISRPSWTWGAEMGINEHDVVIGMTDAYTKGRYEKKGLTGMDLTRLGLERGNSAREALDIMVKLISEVGVGGSNSVDFNLYHNNCFLIMDKQDKYVLETANKHWAYKKCTQANLSDCLSLSKPDECDEKKTDFRKNHSNDFVSSLNGSRKRLAKTASLFKLDTITLTDIFNTMRSHSDKDAVDSGSNTNICMHAGRRSDDHTVFSMVVAFSKEGTKIYVTATSCPCISIYKPIRFGVEVDTSDFWHVREIQNRKLFSLELTDEFYRSRDLTEAGFINSKKSFDEMMEEEMGFYSKWIKSLENKEKIDKGFANYWKKINEDFEEYL